MALIEISQRLFSFDYQLQLPSNFDTALTDTDLFQQYQQAVAHLRPNIPALHLDRGTFDTAVALCVHAVLWGNDIDFVDTQPIDTDLTESIGRLPGDDLLAVATYLLGFDTWHLDEGGDYLVNKADFQERLKVDTVNALIDNQLKLIVEKYIEQVRPVLQPLSQVFNNVPEWAIAMLARLFNAVEEEAPLTKADRLRLQQAKAQLNKYPHVPDRIYKVSFRVDDLSFTLLYAPYKVELSVDQSINTGFGSDYEQLYCFQYEKGGYVDIKGDSDEFEALFLEMLESATSVSISAEE